MNPRRKGFLTLITDENAAAFVRPTLTRLLPNARPKRIAANPHEAKLKTEIEQKGLQAGRDSNIDLIRSALKIPKRRD